MERAKKKCNKSHEWKCWAIDIRFNCIYPLANCKCISKCNSFSFWSINSNYYNLNLDDFSPFCCKLWILLSTNSLASFYGKKKPSGQWAVITRVTTATKKRQWMSRCAISRVTFSVIVNVCYFHKMVKLETRMLLCKTSKCMFSNGRSPTRVYVCLKRLITKWNRKLKDNNCVVNPHIHRTCTHTKDQEYDQMNGTNGNFSI